MIAPYLATAIDAPLADRPNHLVAEVGFVAERDRCSLFSAAMDQWYRHRDREPELAI